MSMPTVVCGWELSRLAYLRMSEDFPTETFPMTIVLISFVMGSSGSLLIYLNNFTYLLKNVKDLYEYTKNEKKYSYCYVRLYFDDFEQKYDKFIYIFGYIE